VRLRASASGLEAQMRKSPPKADHRDSFAREITRAEFGRHYWDDERAAEVRRACGKKETRPKKR
jgi:hypothetical protein